MKIDGFVIAMVVAVLLAFLAPQLGAADSPLPLSAVTDFGISLVFFLHGAALSSTALRAGATNWRLHLFVQSATFLLFPAIGAALYFGTARFLDGEVRLGLFYLCALPSTISSSVAMTSLGRGNVPAAVFNATVSGLIGMIVTPLLVGLVSTVKSTGIPILPAIEGIALKLLLPFILGIFLQPAIGERVRRHKRFVSLADRGVIVLIAYAAFCQSVLDGLWSRYSWLVLIEIFAIVAVLLTVVLTMTTWASRLLGFPQQDEVAAVFCGSKKSMASGAPMAKILFGTSPTLGMIMLPMMLFHQLQLIVCSMLARRYAVRAQEAAVPSASAKVSAA